MPIDQPRLRKLTPEHIKDVARKLRPGNVQSWSTTVEGKRFPVKQLVREAAASLAGDLPPLSEGTTAHEAVCVLSHNGFTSRNESWGGGASIQAPASPASPSDNDQLYGYILALRVIVRRLAHALIEQADEGSEDLRTNLINHIESARDRLERTEGGNKTARDAELAELQTFIYNIRAEGQGSGRSSSLS